MKIIFAKDYDEMSRKAADIIFAQVVVKENSVLGLATGSSPMGIYKELVKRYENGDVSFKNVTTVNLDEYRGLKPDHDQSYSYFMHDNFFDHVDIDPEHTHLPDGCAADPDKECEEYEKMIKALGGTDLQLLGIGFDGHIGFNEPGEAFALGTHLVDLDESTIEANKRFFDNDASRVPKQAFSMGIRTIMQAKKVVLIVSGAGKAEIVKQAFFGPVTPHVPASILQLHPDFTLIGDSEALSLCPQ